VSQSEIHCFLLISSWKRLWEASQTFDIVNLIADCDKKSEARWRRGRGLLLKEEIGKPRLQQHPTIETEMILTSRCNSFYYYSQ
jgi:hypothetical protein